MKLVFKKYKKYMGKEQCKPACQDETLSLVSNSNNK